jgi:hypothetical protein
VWALMTWPWERVRRPDTDLASGEVGSVLGK